MFYPDELVEEVREKVDIVDVISDYVKLRKKGSSYMGLCPFHNEKTPSFSVSGTKQIYHCFGCGAGGNVFTFLMSYENYSFPEALQLLADRAGIKLPEMNETSADREARDKKGLLLEMHKEAATYYYKQLVSDNGKQALTYLKNRKLSIEIIKAFGLGYATKQQDDLYRFLKTKGYSDELLVQSGLVFADDMKGATDKFWNRVIFPIMDANQKVVGFGGRVMGDGKPKYLNSPETMIFNKSRNLYGLHRARVSRKPYFLLCEGYMDVIALHQAGFSSAVASLGTALTAGHARLIKRYVKDIYLCYDSDEAGTKAMLRAIPILKEVDIMPKVITMSPYKDPDEFISNLGADEFQKRVDEAQNAFMFSLRVIEKNYDMKSPEGRTSFMKEMAKHLMDFTEDIERTNYINAAAEQYHIRADDLRKLVSRMAVEGGLAQPVKRNQSGIKLKEKEDGTKKAQKGILTWLAACDNALYNEISAHISPDDFSDGIYREVARLLFEQHNNQKVIPAKIISHFDDEEKQREVAALFHMDMKDVETEADQEKALREMIILVKKHRIECAIENLEEGDFDGLSKLLKDKLELQNMGKLHISLN